MKKNDYKFRVKRLYLAKLRTNVITYLISTSNNIITSVKPYILVHNFLGR